MVNLLDKKFAASMELKIALMCIYMGLPLNLILI
jgi:hypothetical protein